MEMWTVGGRKELLTKLSPTSLFVVEKNKKVENCTRWGAEPAWQVDAHLQAFSWGLSASRYDYLPPVLLSELLPRGSTQPGFSWHSRAPSCSCFPERSQHLHPAGSLLSCPLPTSITPATEILVLALLFKIQITCFCTKTML